MMKEKMIFLFSFCELYVFSQITYSKDTFGNTVQKDEYGKIQSTYSKGTFSNTVKKGEYRNIQGTYSKDAFGNSAHTPNQ